MDFGRSNNCIDMTRKTVCHFEYCSDVDEGVYEYLTIKLKVKVKKVENYTKILGHGRTIDRNLCVIKIVHKNLHYEL